MNRREFLVGVAAAALMPSPTHQANSGHMLIGPYGEIIEFATYVGGDWMNLPSGRRINVVETFCDRPMVGNLIVYCIHGDEWEAHEVTNASNALRQ